MKTTTTPWLIGAALAAILGSLLTAGCNRGGQETSDSRPRVALVVKTLNSPFFLDMQRGAEQAARQRNVNLIVQAAEREVDVERQMQIVENLIQTHVDVLCLAPSGSKELVPVVGKANRAGIPVLIVDSKLDEATAKHDGVATATFIGSDNYEGGRIAGAHFGALFTNATDLIVLEGIPGHETADSRVRGFRDGIKPFPQLHVVASQPADNERDKGFNVMQNLLQSQRDVKGVFASNDMMALGALEAIRAAGKLGQIKVVGFDAVDEARQEIAAGNMEASVAQNPEAMGRLAVENAVKVLNGEKVPDYIPVAIQLVTKDTATPPQE
ncbi:MAG: sugar ABC transporter substrate-binding protein [Verrucomicrobiales bacterium]|nr:sugar ABC transporter substrate-binding protein [Verrucomicrobiales bacterium]